MTIWQVDEHPSPSTVFPSSHESFGAEVTEFPHKVQFEGTPVQFHPDAFEQLAKHPSVGIKFPSSQASIEAICPLPHTAQELKPVPTHNESSSI